MKAYFDYQSSTPVLPEVLEAMAPYWREMFAPASALHQQGLAVRDALGTAREKVAAMMGAASAEEILFTSGGTESMNLAVEGAARAGHRRGRHIVLSTVEHPAVDKTAAFLEGEGFPCTRVAVDGEGFVDPEAVREAITDETCLVCVHHANHDLGTIQPVERMAMVAREAGVPLFVDATLSGGWLPMDVKSWGVGLVALAPHRFYGPKGVGVLYRNRRVALEPVLRGGLQEEGYRAGTENVPGIVGCGVAAELAVQRLEARRAHTGRLQREIWEGLQPRVSHLGLNGPLPGESRLTTNLNLSVEFVEGEGLALMSDVRGIALASGASCVSKSLKGSPVLEAIGLDRSLAQSNVILSLGEGNTDAERDYFLETFPQIVTKLRGMSPQWEDFQQGRTASQLEGRARDQNP